MLCLDLLYPLVGKILALFFWHCGLQCLRGGNVCSTWCVGMRWASRAGCGLEVWGALACVLFPLSERMPWWILSPLLCCWTLSVLSWRQPNSWRWCCRASWHHWRFCEKRIQAMSQTRLHYRGATPHVKAWAWVHVCDFWAVNQPLYRIWFFEVLVAAGHHLSKPNEECHKVSDATSGLAQRGCVCVCVAQGQWILLMRSPMSCMHGTWLYIDRYVRWITCLGHIHCVGDRWAWRAECGWVLYSFI